MDGSFFGFNSRPFAAAPVVESYFPAQTIERSRQTLIRVIQRAEGPGLVIGAAGVGKSLLCQLLAAYFRDSFDVVMLSSVRICTRKALLQNILFELELPYRDMEEGELRLSLLDFLQPGQSNPNGLLLLVDEAHALPMRLLDEVRMITNLVRDGQPRARLVLAGNPKLDERFAHPKLDSFNQRLAARCYLEPLTHDETIHYVRSQINSAGGDPDTVFTEDALEAVHRASGGVPRLINQVCDHALLLAAAGGRRQLEATGIDEAWADLQQLPAPWYGQGTQSPADDVVEFGELDAEAPAAAPETPSDPPATVETPTVVLSQEDDLTSHAGDAAWLHSTWQYPVPNVNIAEELAELSTDTLDGQPLNLDFQGDDSPEVVLSWPGAPETTPPDTAPPEADQPSKVDPFGDAFEEEEVVIDQYASLELEAFRGRPQVIGDESLELATALPPISASDVISVGDEAAQATDEDVSEQAAIDPPALAANPSVSPEAEHVSGGGSEVRVAPSFEYTVIETATNRDLTSDVTDTLQAPLVPYTEVIPKPDAEFCCVELADAKQPIEDDRDLMVVQRDEQPLAASNESIHSTSTSPTPDEPAREYQQLFNQLRKS